MMGAVLSEDFRCLLALTKHSARQQVLLSGLPHLQPAWTFALKRHGLSVRRLDADETERCFLTGMLRIFQHRPAQPA
jgi:2-keto-3-deoxy-galactonokinase